MTKHIIYKTTCSITGRYYIGMHSTDNLDDGYIGSGRRLQSSVEKHGLESHLTVVLEMLPDRASLAKREAEIVADDLLRDPMCMNLKTGGEGGWQTHNIDPNQRHHRQAGARAMNKTLWSNPEWVARTKDRVSEQTRRLHAEGKIFGFTGQEFAGKHHSDETKAIISEIAKQRTTNSSTGNPWMTNVELKVSKKIKSTEVESHLANGWIFGRKMKF